MSAPARPDDSAPALTAADLGVLEARARATVSAGALAGNLAALSGRAGVPLIVPVKANAYGHGLEAVVRAAHALEAVWGFAVAVPREAAEVALLLRALGSSARVLLLTPATAAETRLLADLGVRLPLGTPADLAALPPHARAHLKVDTGMNRLGASPADAVPLGRAAHQRGLLEGVYTHFAAADEPDLSSAEAQLAAFMAVAAHFPGALAHAANGGAVLSFGRLPGLHLARPGLASYGYAPAHLRSALPLSPVLRLEARVTATHVVPAGQSVSYGGLWTAPADTRVATIGAGYADGYPRAATGRASVRVGGERRAVLGRVCMDQMMVNVQGRAGQALDVRVGDWLELMGDPASGAASVHPSEVAAWGELSEYELLTGLGARVERRLGD